MVFNMTISWFCIWWQLCPVLFADAEEQQSLALLRSPSSLTRLPGQSAVFPCVAEGFPPPHIRWTRNEEELPTDG